jgi:hypothetical protein
VEYTCNESFASRTRFSGPTGGNLTESPAHQLPLLGFGKVNDSHSLKGQLSKGFASDMMYDCSSKREDRDDRRESSEPMLRLHEEYTHSLARTAPAIGGELAALPHLSCDGVHRSSTDAVDRDHLEAGCFPFLSSFLQTFQGPHTGFGSRFYRLSEVLHE